MAISYLHDPNHLLVHIVPKILTENDELLTYIGLRAKYNMTGTELKKESLEVWNLKEEKQSYKLVTWLGGQNVEIEEDKTLYEMGIRNGAPIQIVEVS